MSTQLIYKGHTGSVRVEIEGGLLFGRIQDIPHIVLYEGNTLRQLKEAFEGAVDRYVDYCSLNKVEEHKKYSGSLSVRIPKELHREAAFAANERDITINALVKEALIAYLGDVEA